MPVQRISYLNQEDGSVEVNLQMIPMSLRSRVPQLLEYLNHKFKDRQVNRQMLRELERETLRWVNKSRSVNFLVWNKKEQAYEIVPEKLPNEVQDKLPALAELLNMTFYDAENNDITLIAMNTFIEEWVNLALVHGNQGFMGIMGQLIQDLRDGYDGKAITPEVRRQVAQHISNFLCEKGKELAV